MVTGMGEENRKETWEQCENTVRKDLAWEDADDESRLIIERPIVWAYHVQMASERDQDLSLPLLSMETERHCITESSIVASTSSQRKRRHISSTTPDPLS